MYSSQAAATSSLPPKEKTYTGYFTDYAESRHHIHSFPSGKQYVMCPYFQKTNQSVKHKRFVAVSDKFIISDDLTACLSIGQF
jgi:hypothetical protein